VRTVRLASVTQKQEAPSGGAVWRIYPKVDGEKPEVAGSRHWEVPCY
jgi:hypothetical protein